MNDMNYAERQRGHVWYILPEQKPKRIRKTMKCVRK
jgi:hypothetical protein